MNPDDVILLFQNPRKLLRRCYLSIAGGGVAPPPVNGQAPTATFKVTIDDFKVGRGFTTGLSGLLGKKKDRVFVYITKVPGPAKPMLAAGEFNAYYVPMVQTSDVTTGSSHYTLPTAGPLDIMITSKLSGCTFGVGSDANGAKLVTHVQPNRVTPFGPQRDDELRDAVRTGFDTRSGEFRKRREYAETAAVIGHRTGTVWKFYLQATDFQDLTDVISKVEVIR